MTGGRLARRARQAGCACTVALSGALVTTLLAGAAPASATLVYEKGAASPNPSIWVSEDSGASQRLLVGGSGGAQPLIAPDGSSVIFLSLPAKGNAALEIVPVAGGPPSVLAAEESNIGSTAWSPDSKTIATTLGTSPEHERLVLIDVTTRSVRTIATGTFQGVSFSPDSTQLVYARAPNTKSFPSASDIYTAAVAGGVPKRITNTRRSTMPVWGPTKIAFARTFTVREHGEHAAKTNVWLMNPDGSQPRQLTHQKVPFLLYGVSPLAWSASGAQLLAQFTGEDTVYGEGVDPQSGAAHVLSPRRSIAYGLVASAISRDGSKVLATTGGFEPGGGAHDIVTVPFGGGPPTTLVRNAFAPSWTG